ncbi:hypothetical protein HZH68_008063 [Vespula germanica]|uniref:FAM194 C-terminal domain-containing protein n=1 Tax=Vespula germanica TaxID=30212 RepID=A0A834K3R1_VESGE|nr:hypothetical protein HZH68_008063 [Vespula germanica]
MKHLWVFAVEPPSYTTFCSSLQFRVARSRVSKKCVKRCKKLHSHDTSCLKSEKECLKRTILCGFCDDAINDVVRKLFLPPICYKSFCKDAEHLHGLWKKVDRPKSDSINDNFVINDRSLNKQGIRSDVNRKKTYDYKYHDKYDYKYNDKNDYKYHDKNDYKHNDKYDYKYRDNYGDNNNERIINSNKHDAKYLIKNRNRLRDRKGDTFKVKSNFKKEEIKTDKKNIRGKEEDSRGRLNRSRGQERPGKMIHDRTNEKIPLTRRPREGKKEIEKDEEMTPRRKTKETYRQSEGKGNKTSSVVVPKKGDVLDRESEWAYRDGDEEKNFLRNREKRKNVHERNEGNDQTRNPGSEKKYKMDTETSTINPKFENNIEDKNTRLKGSKFTGSSLATDEDFTRKNESRYRQIKTIATLPFQNRIDSPNTIEYQLSNEHFVKLGWTVLPIRKFMRKIYLYESKMAKPHLDWFKKYRYEDRRYYEDGVTPFLSFHPDETGKVFYPNGRTAVKIHKPENREYDMYTVFTPGGKDIVGITRKPQIIAVFDSLCNGVILDENGITRLSYNQIGGIWRDNPGGLPFLWTWSSNVEEPIIENVYSIKSMSELERLFPSLKKDLESISKKNTQTSLPSPMTSDMREKAEIARDEQKPVVVNAVVEEREKYLESEFFNDKREVHSMKEEDNKTIKIICMKLNKYLSFRILNRRNINLKFFAGTKSIRIELGTILDYDKKLKSYHEDATDWKKLVQRCRFQDSWEKSVRTDSLHNLSREMEYVKRCARQRKIMLEKYKP